jgi:hypothetical protein
MGADRSPVFLIVVTDSCCVGLAPIDGDLVGHAMPAYGLDEKTLSSPLIPLLGE